jgi:hypothetical protein
MIVPFEPRRRQQPRPIFRCCECGVAFHPARDVLERCQSCAWFARLRAVLALRPWA